MDPVVTVMRVLLTVTALLLALIVTASTMTGFVLFVPALLVIPVLVGDIRARRVRGRVYDTVEEFLASLDGS